MIMHSLKSLNESKITIPSREQSGIYPFFYNLDFEPKPEQWEPLKQMQGLKSFELSMAPANNVSTAVMVVTAVSSALREVRL